MSDSVPQQPLDRQLLTNLADESLTGAADERCDATRLAQFLGIYRWIERSEFFKRSRPPSQPDLAVRLAEMRVDIAEGIKATIEDSLVPVFGGTRSLALAGAISRGKGTQDHTVTRTVVLAKQGRGCCLQVNASLHTSATSGDSSAVLSLGVLDDQGKPLHPFNLTALDVEKEKLLLFRKPFAHGQARLNDVRRGEYLLSLDAGASACAVFTVKLT